MESRVNRKVVVVLERDPGTELKAKALLLRRVQQGFSTSPQGNSSVPCFLCGQASGRGGQGSGDGSFRDSVAEVFARSVEEFSERGQGSMEDCWRGESCPSCFALMEGVWTLQGKIEGLRGEVKALVDSAVGLRGSGSGGLEEPSEEETESEGREKKGRMFFRTRRNRRVQISTLDSDGNSNKSPCPVFTRDERPDLRPAPVAHALSSSGGTPKRGKEGPAKKKRKRGKMASCRSSCYFCQKPFPSLSTLEVHLRTHLKEKPHLCNLCGKEFSDKGTLENHIRRHLKEKPFKCLHKGCTSSFSAKKDLKSHSRVHSGEKPCKCNLCGRRFSQKSSLNRHIRFHLKEKAHTCNLCGKGFVTKGELDDHIRRHLKEKPFKCPHPGCSFSFVSGSDLKNHSRVHSGEKPFKCTFCGKGWPRKTSLDDHIRRHLKEKAYKCPHEGCKSSFVTAGELKRHSRVHSGEKPFPCAYPNCGKFFSEQSTLKNHSRTHSGERPFLCLLQGCGKDFTRKSYLVKHQRTCTSI